MVSESSGNLESGSGKHRGRACNQTAQPHMIILETTTNATLCFNSTFSILYVANFVLLLFSLLGFSIFCVRLLSPSLQLMPQKILTNPQIRPLTLKKLRGTGAASQQTTILVAQKFCEGSFQIRSNNKF